MRPIRLSELLLLSLLVVQGRLSESTAPLSSEPSQHETCGHARMVEKQMQLLSQDKEARYFAADAVEARRQLLREVVRQVSGSSPGAGGAPGFPLEVQFDTSDLQANLKDAQALSFLTGQLLPRVSKYLSNLLRLKVPPNSAVSPFYVDCYAKRFSRSFVFRGGLGILLTASDYGETDLSYVAFSLVCKQDVVTGRPLLGQVNFNPGEIKLRNFDSMFETTVHEVFHLLGFSALLFPQFLDENFMPVDPYASFRLDARGRIAAFKTPALLREARAYYNCSSVEELPLEDEGSVGSQYSHWERSHFGDEVMTASSTADSKVSVFTLALFEDSGWYYPNYTMKEEFTFLRDCQCDFSVQQYACPTIAAQVCTYNSRSQGYCSPDSFNNGMFRRSGNTFGRCTAPKPASHKVRFHQAFSRKSFCFEADLRQREGKVQVALQGPGCFEAVCYHNDGKARVRLKINNLYYECVSDFEKITLKLDDMAGTVTCPDIRLFCLNDHLCEDRCVQQGRCLDDGRCYKYD